MSDPSEATTPPKLNQVNIVVRDMDAMAAFYTHLGVPLLDSPPEWQPHHRNGASDDDMSLDLDSSDFAGSWNEGWPRGEAGVVIGFEVVDAHEVDRLYEHLTGLGYVGQQSPYDTFWGSRYAIMADPDGNSVGIMSPIDPARASKPPDPPH